MASIVYKVLWGFGLKLKKLDGSISPKLLIILNMIEVENGFNFIHIMVSKYIIISFLDKLIWYCLVCVYTVQTMRSLLQNKMVDMCQSQGRVILPCTNFVIDLLLCFYKIELVTHNVMWPCELEYVWDISTRCHLFSTFGCVSNKIITIFLADRQTAKISHF